MNDEPSANSGRGPAAAQEARAAVDPEQLPGRRLRAARERRQWSVEEVAGRLHLHPSQVAALENDDYSPFAAPIFVNGYLRNYARLLGLNAETLVAAAEQTGLEEPPILSELTMNRPRSRLRLLSSDAWAGVLVVAGLALLLLLWAGTRPPHESGGPGPGDLPPPAMPSAAQPEPSPAPTAPGAGEERAQGAADAAPPATGPARASDELLLSFTGDSWVEIADADGQRLMYRMGQAGEEVRLRGRAPFDILLGNAPAVAIEYNGEPYKRIPVSRQNVASFRLGVR